jgi:hypothetical protein
MVESEIKGEKSTIGSLKSAVILPKPRGVIFCQPPFSGLFLREKKWFSARCGTLKVLVSQKKSQKRRRAINSTPFSDFFRGVLGQ